MFGDGALSFREFATREPLPLATVHDAVLDFLRGRADAVLCGSEGVNAYVDESRMGEDVDVLSIRAEELAEEIHGYLNKRFGIATQICNSQEGSRFRVFQPRAPRPRNLVDLRWVKRFPLTRRVQDVLVLAPAELIAHKVMACVSRRGASKAYLDRRDLGVLLLAFPELKRSSGPVRDRLLASGADADALAAWDEIVAEPLEAEEEWEKFQ